MFTSPSEHWIRADSRIYRASRGRRDQSFECPVPPFTTFIGVYGTGLRFLRLDLSCSSRVAHANPILGLPLIPMRSYFYLASSPPCLRSSATETPRAPNTSLRRKPLPINRDSILVVDDSASPTDTRCRTDSPVPRDPALPKHYGQPSVSDTPSPPPVFEPSPSSTPEPPSAPVSESPSSPSATTQSKPLPPPPEAAPPRPPAHAQQPESPMMAATSVMPLTGPGPMVPEKPAPIVTQQPQSPPQDEALSARPVSNPKGPTKLSKANRESDPKRPQSSMQSGSPPPPPSREGSSAERSSRVIRPPQGRARSASAQPLGSRRSSFGPRIMSQAMDAMRGFDTRQLAKNPPQTQNAQNQTPAKTVEKLRRSIMPAAPKPRAKSLDNQAIPGLDAWIISPDDTKAEYNTSLLTNAERVRRPLTLTPGSLEANSARRCLSFGMTQETSTLAFVRSMMKRDHLSRSPIRPLRRLSS